jgi:cytosine/adenosine deaminase-related metal-dependent hydrolase
MLLLKNISHLYTLNDYGSVLRDAWVLIDDKRIKLFGTGNPANLSANETIDLSGCVVFPGFINLHHHLFQSVTRAVKNAERANSIDWLANLYNLWARLQPEDYHAATRLAVAELLLSGCTTTVDHAYLLTDQHTETLAAEVEAVGDLGIRLHLVRGCLPSLEADLERRLGSPIKRIIDRPDTILSSIEDDIRQYHDDSALSMISVSLGPTTPTYAMPHLMVDIANLARQYDLGLQTHYHPRPAERELAMKITGMSPLAFLEKSGWLTPRTFLAHCTQLDDEEIRSFAAHNVAIVHCPRTILRLGYPVTRITDMRKYSVRIGVGVDGAASNDGGSFIGELRLALVLHRAASDATAVPEKDWLSTEEILHMATRGAAAILGRNDIGHIDSGMAADLAAFSLDQLAQAGVLDNPLGALFLAGNDGPAKLTMVNGNILVRDGKLVQHDAVDIVQAANKSAKRLGRGTMREQPHALGEKI